MVGLVLESITGHRMTCTAWLASTKVLVDAPTANRFYSQPVNKFLIECPDGDPGPWLPAHNLV